MTRCQVNYYCCCAKFAQHLYRIQHCSVEGVCKVWKACARSLAKDTLPSKAVEGLYKRPCYVPGIRRTMNVQTARALHLKSLSGSTPNGNASIHCWVRAKTNARTPFPASASNHQASEVRKRQHVTRGPSAVILTVTTRHLFGGFDCSEMSDDHASNRTFPVVRRSL